MSKADRIKIKRAATSLALMKDGMERALDRSFLAAIEALESVTVPPQPALVKELEEDIVIEESNNEKA